MIKPLPYRSIFVPHFPSEGAVSAAINYAAAFAARAQGHLTVRVLGLHLSTPFSLASGLAGGYVDAANDETRRQVDAAVLSIRNRFGVGTYVLDAAGKVGGHVDLVRAVTSQGRLHDLAIIDRLPDFLSEGRAMMEALLFDSGRPVIVVPPGADAFSARRIAIGWDGSARAVRAAHDALPLLAAADIVQLVCITEDRNPAKSVAGADFAPCLVRHGVTVEIVDVAEKDSAAGPALLKQAESFGADLIVMGAFGHNRFRQLVLGGATQTMLEKATVPVFFAH